MNIRSIQIAGMLIALLGQASAAEPPCQTTGVKIGEPGPHRVLVWTRLTREPAPREDGRVEGAPGDVRVVYWEREKADAQLRTAWEPVDPARDFTHRFALEGLRPSTSYGYRVESRGPEGKSAGQSLEGRFRTAPAPERAERVVFTVVTGQGYHRRDDAQNGHRIYPRMAALEPSFFVHTGDVVYYDRKRPVATSIELARLHWQRMYALPFQRAFHLQVPSYFIKDDHDTWCDDCWPGMRNEKMGSFTFAQGQAVFREQVPVGERPFRSHRWGTDLEIWLPEGRDFRSPNSDPDGPQKSIWGAEQIAWFERTVRASDATFRILISPTPIVGPDRTNKNDNHANAGFAHEGRRLRRFLSAQRDMLVICGDRHWQYVSVDPETGLREFSCGPTSNKHAGGFSEEKRQPMHRYLKICGGFLSGTVERIEGRPTLTLRHHAVNGKVLHEERIESAPRRRL